MKRVFKVKSIFVSFKGLSVARNCVRPDSAPLIGLNCLEDLVRLYLSVFL